MFPPAPFWSGSRNRAAHTSFHLRGTLSGRSPAICRSGVPCERRLGSMTCEFTTYVTPWPVMPFCKASLYL